MEGFRHKLEIQVRFKDIDRMGHVNNANYFTYVESARCKYFDHVLGVQSDWHLQDGVIMAHVDMDFRAPLMYDDEVVVYTRCSRLGTKSFDLAFRIMRLEAAAGGEVIRKEMLAAEGKTVIACYDYDLKKTIPIPAEKRKKIELFEGLL